MHPSRYLVAKLEQIRGDTFRPPLEGLLQPVELVKPCFLAPPAPSKQLGKELQLSGALPLEPVISAPIWQGSCRSRRWSRSRSPAKGALNKAMWCGQVYKIMGEEILQTSRLSIKRRWGKRTSVEEKKYWCGAASPRSDENKSKNIN